MSEISEWILTVAAVVLPSYLTIQIGIKIMQAYYENQLALLSFFP